MNKESRSFLFSIAVLPLACVSLRYLSLALNWLTLSLDLSRTALGCTGCPGQSVRSSVCSSRTPLRRFRQPDINLTQVRVEDENVILSLQHT